jgi:hypothetical protein
MNTSANAFIIVLQHDPLLFSPLKKCALACGCVEASALIKLSWARATINDLSFYRSGANEVCKYCSGNKAKLAIG